jgi:glycosyltransferase involved in cell wall biosynthesis
MYLYLLQVKLVARRLGLSHIISWFSNPTYVTIAGKFNELCFWYDCTDDWSQMPGNTKSMTLLAKKQQNAILKLADIVTAVSESLYKNAKRINSNSHLVPNGVDVVFYSSAKRKIKELDNIKKPIFGYVGSIWEDRLDISLIKYLAKNKPEWSFVFIGPITIELKSDIKGIENLFFLGKRPYKDLPSYMNEFDVCLIPHKVNELTNSMNPIKLFEYMATGKPIVSTDVAGVSEYSDVVMIAEDDNEFIEMCNKALNCNNDLADKQLEYASDNSWSRRVDKIESLMHETINNHS